MRKVFNVELGARNGIYTELTLPAAPYAVLDALEKLRLEEGEPPDIEILDSGIDENIVERLYVGGALSGLNTLAQQLSLLDERQLAIVEGLVKMEFEKGAWDIRVPRLIDIAHSMDRCYFLTGITTDAQLGRFCAENGFVPEADDLSDEAFELLDFEKIGLEFRQNEGGVFTSQGYVQRHDELSQVSKDMDFTLVKPDYAILVQTASGCEVRLPVPLGDPTGDEPALCLDCAAPALTGMNGAMSAWDMLAHRLAELEVDGDLPKYKALVEAVGCDDICRALSLADELDQYSLSPELLEMDEVAEAKLDQLLPDDVCKALLPHVQLYAFGNELVQAQGSRLTEYGLIERTDGGPIHAADQEPAKGGMEMM